VEGTVIQVWPVEISITDCAIEGLSETPNFVVDLFPLESSLLLQVKDKLIEVKRPIHYMPDYHFSIVVYEDFVLVCLWTYHILVLVHSE